MSFSIWAWAGFGVFILLMLALDLGVLNRKAHVVTYREATVWSVVWVTLAMLFAGWVFWTSGSLAGKEFLAGYLIELSLSVDNLFVFLLLFSYFKVPSKYQHRVLFWGVLGALVMRITMIGAGAALIERFHWILYLFGLFLIYTGFKMLRQEETDVRPEENAIVRAVTRHIPVVRHYEGEHFFTLKDGRRAGTLLLLVLVVVEITDLIFAVDSIPAIFAITADAFLVFTSNVFAMLGLRSLYFALAEAITKFRYLKYSLALVLAVVGVKMLAANFFKQLLGQHFNFYLLGVIAIILAAGVAASLLHDRRRRQCARSLSIPSS